MSPGLCFHPESGLGKNSLPLRSGCWKNSFPATSMTEGFGFLLSIVWRPLLDPRGCPKFPEAVHSSLLHEFLNMAAYFIEPERRISLQSAKMESYNVT